MRLARDILAVFSSLLTILCMGAATAIAITGGVDLFGFTLELEKLDWLVRIGAISALIAMLVVFGGDNGTVLGAGVVILGAIVIAPSFSGLVGGTAIEESPDQSLSARLERTVSVAELIELAEIDGKLRYPGKEDQTQVELVERGLAAFRFVAPRDAPVRISIDDSSEVIDGGGDPFVELFSLADIADPGGNKQLLGRDNDGGDNRNARIDYSVEAGQAYLILVRDIGSSAISTSQTFMLSIKERDASLYRGSAVLSYGAACTPEAPVTSCFTRLGQNVESPRKITDKDMFLLTISDASELDVCLGINVTPTDPKADGQDTVVGLFSTNRDLLDRDDDSNGLNERFVVLLPAQDEGTEEDRQALLYIGAYNEGTVYNLKVALVAAVDGGLCPASDTVFPSDEI